MLQSPIIVSPITNWVPGYNNTYYTSNPIQQLLGTISVPVGLSSNALLTVAYSYQIQRSNTIYPFTAYSMAGVTAGATDPIESEVAWGFNSNGYINVTEGDTLTLRFKSIEFLNIFGQMGDQVDESAPIDVIAYIVNANKITATAGIPTGIQLKTYKDSMKILVPKDSILVNENSSFLGCNFYISLSPGGGSSGYQLMNDVYVSAPDASETVNTVNTVSDITNEADGLTVETKTTEQIIIEYYTYTVDKAELKTLVDEGKIGNVFLSDNDTINEDINFYFTTTSAAYDTVLNTAVESYQSYELAGKFLKYRTDFKGLPVRKRQDVLFTMSRRMLANNNLVNIVTGQVIRDVIDPVTEMFEKFYIIQDFIFRCESIDSLLSFDDANGDGISDPVTSSISKTNLANALSVTDADVLQNLINEQFDKQAANFYLTRKAATQASGTVVFYTTRRPTADILISDGTVVTYPGDPNQNIAPLNYTVIGNNIMEASTIDNYYNASKQRYELEASIISVNNGSVNNIPSGTITISAGLPSSIQVENLVPTNYGSDVESNSDLAARIKIARPSFDSGTKPGYTAAAYDVPGVLEVNVQGAGDPLMIRDIDSTTQEHIGGKVDIYIRGNSIGQVVDQLAFKFEHPSDVYGNQVGEVFYVVDSTDFRIKTTNSKVTPDTPIVSVNKVRNVTRVKDYDIANIEIMGDTLILSSTSQTNIAIGMATFDVIEVGYVYRSSNIILLDHQPAIDVSSVADKDGNIIDSSNYRIIKKDDPLKTGNSSIAGYGIEFLFNSDTVPSSITLTAEQHSIRLNQPAKLNFKGVISDTVVVKSSTDSSIIYKIGVDYNITYGNQKEYTYITLIGNGMIRSGDIIAVDYETSPNLFITYTYNSLVSQAQDSINKMKHACADTIIKEAVENMVDLSFDVERDLSIMVSSTGVPTDDEKRLRSRIQTAIYNAIANLKIGQSLTQSFILKTILSVSGVKSVKTPFSIMMKRAESFIPLDDIGNVAFEVFQKSSSAGIVSYRSINSVLSYDTISGGGPDNLFRMVYEDMKELVLVSDATLVSKASGQAYIQSDGRIVVSTTDGRPPQSKYYKAAYYVDYPVGVTYAEDITTTDMEYLSVDSLSFKGIDFIN